MRASRNHVRIECVDDNCFMIDLGSSNGTLVNGRRIEGTAIQLADGDVFTIGCTEFMLRPAPRRSREWTRPPATSPRRFTRARARR